MKIAGFKRGAYIFMNTPEIRERLESLGYKKNNVFGVDGGDAILTYPYYREDCPDQVYPHYVEVTKNYFNNGRYSWAADRVNCGTDVERFFKVVSEKIDN